MKVVHGRGSWLLGGIEEPYYRLVFNDAKTQWTYRIDAVRASCRRNPARTSVRRNISSDGPADRARSCRKFRRYDGAETVSSNYESAMNHGVTSRGLPTCGGRNRLRQRKGNIPVNRRCFVEWIPRCNSVRTASPTSYRKTLFERVQVKPGDAAEKPSQDASSTPSSARFSPLWITKR